MAAPANRSRFVCSGAVGIAKATIWWCRLRSCREISLGVFFRVFDPGECYLLSSTVPEELLYACLLYSEGFAFSVVFRIVGVRIFVQEWLVFFLRSVFGMFGNLGKVEAASMNIYI